MSLVGKSVLGVRARASVTRKLKKPLSMLAMSLCVLVILSMFTPLGATIVSYSNQWEVERAVDFLVNRQFNRDLNLCRDSPYAEPNTYWLVSDNLWAWKALKLASESDLPNANEAGKVFPIINARLIELAANYHLPIDSYNLPISYSHEAVIGDIALPPYNSTKPRTLYDGSYVLNTTIPSTMNITDWTNYTDLVLYAALSYQKSNFTTSSGLFERARNMWDGIGINDTAAKKESKYATYKLALLLYTSKVLNSTLTFEYELTRRIWDLQRDTDGGIVTDYFPNGTASGDANTETTSIAIISALTPSKQTLGTFAFYYPWYGVNASSGRAPNASRYWFHWDNSSDNSAEHIPNSTDEFGRRDIAAADYPLLDVYDSRSKDVIEQHVTMAKRAGIDGFIVSWWAINSFSDQASKVVKNVCESNDFKFTFLYEPAHANETQTQDEINYLLANYSQSNAYLKIDGRPVIFIYVRARNDLNPQAWRWHACVDNSGIDPDPNSTNIENSSAYWMLSEDVRNPPHYGIIPIQPFQNTSGYIENLDPIFLPPNDAYVLKTSISDIRNDSGQYSDVNFSIRVKGQTGEWKTLDNRTVNFNQGWVDQSFDISEYAGQNVTIRVESQNGGVQNWSCEWAAVDYLYIIINSTGQIISPDPFFDNGWKALGDSFTNRSLSPYIVMDYGGYEAKIQDLITYFDNSIDGLNVYNPVDYSSDPSTILATFKNVSDTAHSNNRTFFASIIPGFNNTVTISPYGTAKPSVIDRQNGAYYTSMWEIAKASHPDGYLINSFNEWHEGSEIEPSVQYGYQYIDLTRTIQGSESYADLMSAYYSLNSAYRSIVDRITELESNYTNLQKDMSVLNRAYLILLDDIAALNNSYNNLEPSMRSLNSSLRDSISELNESMNTQLDNLQTELQNLRGEQNNERNLIYVLAVATSVLLATTFYLARKKPKKAL